MKIIDRGVVVAGRENTEDSSSMFPCICVLPSRRWVCGFRSAPKKTEMKGQKSCITYSDDEGKTWSEPIAPFPPVTVNGKPGIFRKVYVTALGENSVLAHPCWVDHTDPDVPFFNPKTEGLLDSKNFFSISGDGGKTWSEPKLIDLSPFEVPCPSTGPILVLQNNEWICPFETNKHYNDSSPTKHFAVFKFSKDNGKTWNEHSVTAHDTSNRIFYWDQRQGVSKEGTILNVLWTYDTKKAIYLNIHSSESKDNGRTWSEIRDTGVPGQPSPPVFLADGRVFLAYVDRTSIPVIKARISGDGGRTFPENTEILIHKREMDSQTESKKKTGDAWAEMGKFSLGLPATSSMKNGDVVVLYYTGPYADLTDIEWARIKI